MNKTINKKAVASSLIFGVTGITTILVAATAWWFVALFYFMIVCIFAMLHGINELA